MNAESPSLSEIPIDRFHQHHPCVHVTASSRKITLCAYGMYSIIGSNMELKLKVQTVLLLTDICDPLVPKDRNID
jgi:hypothetical protein